MIPNAKDTMRLSNAKDSDDPVSFVPAVGVALHGWMQFMKFKTICKTNNNGYTDEIESTVETHAVRQPLMPQQLLTKPAGQRGWRWEQLHVLPDLDVNLDDKIEYLGVTYRVQAKNSYPEYGYIEYHVVQDYGYLNESPSYE